MQHATSISAEEQRLAAMRSGGGVQGEGGQDLQNNLTCIYDHMLITDTVPIKCTLFL